MTFWARTEPELNTGCVLWAGAQDAQGYGMTWAQGRAQRAHRFAWELVHGPIPRGEGFHGVCVLHKCDTRSCVNPSHLFLGGHRVNMQDMSRKGRHPGSYPKLSKEDVAEIRRLAETKAMRYKDIAAVYGVSQSHIGNIASGGAWKER